MEIRGEKLEFGGWPCPLGEMALMTGKELCIPFFGKPVLEEFGSGPTERFRPLGWAAC